MISEGQICAECNLWLNYPNGTMVLCPKCWSKNTASENERTGFSEADEDSLPWGIVNGEIMVTAQYTKIGTHGFRGSCAPKEGSTSVNNMQTFSLGIFEWLGKKTAPGYKIGKAKVRVVGFCDHSAAVYAKAREIIAQLDAGTYTGPKRVRVVVRQG